MLCFFILTWPTEGQPKSFCLILCYESCKAPKKESFHHNLIYIQMVLAYLSIYPRTKHQYHYKCDEQRCVSLSGKEKSTTSLNLSEVIPDPRSSALQLNIKQILSSPIVCTWWVRGQRWRLRSWFQCWNSAATDSQHHPCRNNHHASSCLPCLISGVGWGGVGFGALFMTSSF